MAGEHKEARQAELFGDGGGAKAAAGGSATGKAAAELNTQQRAAVEHGEGPLLVVAGAGTGKTRVITERIRHLLASDPELPGEAIVGLTFTDKAAAEMKSRVTRVTDERGEKVFLGTFHSFCTNLLIENDPDLKPIEEVDHWILLRRNLPLLQLERYRKLAEPGRFLSDFVKFFSRSQDELVTPERYERYVAELEEALRRDVARGGLADVMPGVPRDVLPEDERIIRREEIERQREIARAYRVSDALLRGEKRLTFGMQMLDAVRALDENAALLAKMRERFRYILVDEFQDTNVAQLELLWRLAGEHRNIVAVGDDAQAIYRFRGASFGSFTIFLEKFAGVMKGDAAAAARFVRPLADNYRSTARVLRVAGQVTSYLERSPLVPKKELVPHKNPGEKVRIVELGSATEEARWIAGEMARLHGAGLPWKSFAALYRIHAHRDALVMALGERGIPFVIRNLSILNHRLVLDVMAYLRLIARPSNDLSCARVLAAPAWGLQAPELARLIERAAKAKKSLWDALQEPQNELPFGDSARHGTDALIAGINELRQRARKLPAADLFDELADWLEIAVAVEAEDRRYVDRLGKFVREWQAKSDWAAPAARAQLDGTAIAAQTRPSTARLSDLMEYLDYFEQANGKIEVEQDSDDAVQLMTVHAAKGLEFDQVFVLRLTKNGFPMGTRPVVLEFPEQLMQEELPAWDYHTQEERRLFYVALTRARERLTLTTVVNTRSKPSLFLDDILSAPQLTREHVEQSAPKAVAAPADRPARREPLFADAARKPKVYSRIGDWALEYRPPVFEPLRLSASSIGTYQKCPQQFLFSNVWGLRGGPNASMTFGSVMHTTIREFLGALRKARPLPPFEEVEAIFRREWKAAGFEDRYQEECYQKDGLEQLRAFHAACVEAPPDICAQEKGFALELDNNVQVTGRIDQVNFIGGPPAAFVAAGAKLREVEIVDYKTGTPKTEEKARKDLQLGIYALAAREALELNATRMVYHSLQNNERVSAGREAKQLAAVRGTIQEAAAEIRAREFPPRPGFYCRSCEYRTICPAKEAGRVLPEEDAPVAASKKAGKAAGKKPRGVTTRA